VQYEKKSSVMISNYKSVIEEKMKRKIFGFLVVLAGLAIMGC